ncbi:NACHT domain-containing protein [Tritonibacter mobilis]|nr:NACHT domain-containing protein [Tritonibacter mobilis]
MAALLALEFDEAEAFEIYQRIWRAHGLRPKTGSQVSRSSSAFPSEAIRSSVLHDPSINQLPAVFETEARLPIATTFVDLRVVERRATFSKDIVQPFVPPGQQIWERERRLRLPKRPAQQVLDGSSIRPSVLIGGPGSGKSALMRRLALDVAEGRWRGAQVPLFVEVRKYWARRSTRPQSELTLLGFALEERLPYLRKDMASRENMELLLLKGEVPGVLLLTDGLDEIGSDPEAVEAIYGELEAITRVVPWIASSRPTGLHRLVGGARRLELDPLSLDAVEQLVTAWSNATEAPQWLAGSLYAEIAASSTLQQMATNPFLLTALCYLRHADLDRALPDSRSSIYQRLFEQIARQVQLRHADKRILDATAMGRLEAFCHGLYADAAAPKQVFSESDWQGFSGDQIDFRSRILPARLVTALSESDPDFHFMHLSLQEHLIARHLLQADLPDVLRLRFHPAWRSVFRAYGALLYGSGREQEFRALVTQLYGETDLLGLSHFNLAEVFSDAGIKDTGPWIGEDLRELLWEMLTEGWNEVPAQALEALRILDAEFLEAKARIAVEDLQGDLEYLREEYSEDFETCVFPGEPYQQYGFEETHAPRVLARSGTSSAHDHIRDLFLNGPQDIALAMATAYADIARPSDRAALAERAITTDPDSEFAYRLFAFAIASPAAELVPFLGRVAEHHSALQDDLWDRALGMLMQVGGEGCVSFLRGFLTERMDAWNAHPKHLREKHSPIPSEVANENNRLVGLVSRFNELDHHEHAMLLTLAEELNKTERHKTMLYGERLKIGRVDDEAVLRDLSSDRHRDEALTALIGVPAKTGTPISTKIRARLLGDFLKAGIDEKALIAELEAASIRAGGTPMAVEVCLAEAKSLWEAVALHPEPAELSLFLTRLEAFLAPAQISQDRRALDLYLSVLREHASLTAIEPDLSEMILALLMDVVRDILPEGGSSLPGHQLRDFVSVFLELVFEESVDVTQNAATAMGYLDLPSLLQLRGASTVDSVLEEISAEEDLMIFPTFWAGKDGAIHTYVDDRPGIVVLAQDDRGDDLAVSLKHQLVGQGFAIGDLEDLRRRFVMGVVVLSQDAETPDPERVEAQDGVISMFRDEWEVALIDVDLAAVEAGSKEAAVEIKERLEGLYSKGRGASNG